MTDFKTNDRVQFINDHSTRGVIRALKHNDTYEIELDSGGKMRKKGDEIEKISDESVDKYENFARGQFDKLDKMKVPLILRKFDYRDNTKIHSMGTANIEYHAYQYKAPLKLMKSYTDSILIADEVGLGKTISAGLCWNELALRYKLSRLLIVCPAPLREKWKAELREKFNIISHVCHTQQDFDKHYENLDQFNGAVIISHHLCRNDDVATLWKKLIENNDRKFDALILDEAHHIKNKSSKLYQAIKDIQEIIEYRIFLSATPIQNKGEDLYSVMSGLDDIYEDKHVFTEYMEQTEQTQQHIRLVQHAKSLPQINNVIDKHKIKHIVKGNPWDTKTQAKIMDVLEKRDVFYNHYTRTRRVHIGMLEKREIENVPFELSSEEQEVIKNVEKCIDAYCKENNAQSKKNFIKTMPLKYLCSSIQSALNKWHDDSIDDSEWDENDNADKQDAKKMITYIAQNMDLNSITLGQDTKYQRLQGLLQKEVKNKKCIVFSQFKNTVAYVKDLLQQDGFSVLSVDGSVKDKHEVVNQFQNQDYDILLTTETLSEGMDLQFCDMIINYDVPWNPMRLEQRIGRIDRIGQKADKIYMYNLYGKDTIDDRIYAVLQGKFETILQYLGDFSPILEQHAKATLDEDEDERKEQIKILKNKAKEFKQELENEKHFLASDQYLMQGIEKQHNEMLTANDLFVLLKTLCDKVYRQSKIAMTEQQDNKIFVSLELCSTTRSDFSNFIRKYNLPKSEIKTKTCLSRVATKEQQLKKYKGYTFITLMHPFISFAQQKLSEMEGKVSVCFAGQIKTDVIPQGAYVIGSSTTLFAFEDEEKINYIRSTGAGYRLDTNFCNPECITESELEKLEKIIQCSNTKIIPSNFTQEIDKDILTKLSKKIEDRLQDIHGTMIDEELYDIDVLSENSKQAIKTAHENKISRLQKEMENMSGEKGKKLRQAQIDKAHRTLQDTLESINNRSPKYDQLEMLGYLALIQVGN